ncbi:exo-alpha-sialidase [Trypanosoma cruzi]|nr:exo-alpha-sialidase [Trypanosoma cruzi]
MRQRAPPLRTGHRGRHGGPSVCAGQPSRGATRHTQQERQTDRQRETNGCRQEALTINTAREHAATPRRNTGEEGEGKKQEAAQHTRKKQTPVSGKSTAAALALAGNSTPALTHTQTPSQCRQSAEKKIRPSTQQTHTPPAVIHQWTKRRRDTPPAPPVQSHGQRDTATAPKPANTTHTEQAITQRAARRSDPLPIHDAAPQSTRSHGVSHFSNRTYSSSIP